VDNKNSSGIRRLRQKIEEISTRDLSLQYRVPMKWIRLLDTIVGYSDLAYLKILEVKELARHVGITSAHELEEALELFNTRGILFYLTSTEALKSIVVLQPQWLVDSLFLILRKESSYRFKSKELKRLGLEDDLMYTYKNAVASRDFLDYVWEEKAQFFIDLIMSTIMLFSECNFGEGKFYLIPSLLQNTDTDSRNQQKKGVRCIFDFSLSFLAPGIFQRLLCLLIAHKFSGGYLSQESEISTVAPWLFFNFGTIELEPGGTIHLSENTTSQTLTVLIEDPKFAPKCLAIVRSKLERINQDVMHQGLRWDVLLETSENSNTFMKLANPQTCKKLHRSWHATKKYRNFVDIENFVDHSTL